MSSTLVASDEARMFTALLPSSSAPIRRSPCPQQAIDHRGAPVAVLLQPVHAGAREAVSGRLAAGEECGQQQADDDREKG